MNEDLILDVLVDTRAGLDNILKLLAVGLVILGLRVNHIDQSAAVLDGLHVLCGGIPQVIVAWKIFDGELYVWVVVDDHGLDLCCRRQEEGLVRRHLLEDDTRYRGLT